MRKKILIVELETHEKNVNESYKIFSYKFDTTVFVTKKIEKNLTIKSNKIISNNYNKLVNYFLLLFYIRKYDYVYFSSFLEYELIKKNIYNYVNFFIKYIAFSLIIFFYKEKIIIKILNIFTFFKVENYNFDFFCLMRNFLLKKNKRFLMETKFLTENLKKYFIMNNIYNKKFACLYNSHTNLSKNKEKIIDKINLGLLGEINNQRKDYNIILNALKKIENKKVNIYFLGTNLGKSSKEIIQKFKNYRIFYTDGYLSDEIFYKWGKSCHILISTNKTTFIKGYGEFKGTGAFGDAIYLSKPLLTLKDVDPICEFKDFTIYYENSDDFLKIFRNLINNKNN